MIKFEDTSVWGFEGAIKGMRLPMKSESDSGICIPESKFCDRCRHLGNEDYETGVADCNHPSGYPDGSFVLGIKDEDLAKRLAKAGPDHRKYLRMIHVQTTITAPVYWVAEHDTYKIGTVRNSESFMHKGASQKFSLERFSYTEPPFVKPIYNCLYKETWDAVLTVLTELQAAYRVTNDEKYFQALRQLLPSGWLVTYVWDANYEVLANIYRQRENHRLPEWHTFCSWIKTLPYSELITGEVAR